ncbi:hypothetical protein F442_06631 [Phytophthora nicotianae P10297]|uniref:HAT C-terminal dimerisation domain-containing protein n=2 Tax=Phytophthora nicotianae TaxID=4792 RepID=W2ZM82_PHYNI|nr:hypothetical protein F442_06631 [Phytophthora nicotianae P10297]
MSSYRRSIGDSDGFGITLRMESPHLTRKPGVASWWSHTTALKSKKLVDKLKGEFNYLAAQRSNEKRRGGEEQRNKYSESSPRDYWSAKGNKKYPLLEKIAEFVFAIHTSSAASERSWSIFDHIHSKRRNRLSVAKVEMLS